MPQIPFQIDFLYYGSSERVVVLIKHVKLVPFPRCDAPKAPPWQAQAPKRSEPPFILLVFISLAGGYAPAIKFSLIEPWG